jgi:hypothetical protein
MKSSLVVDGVCKRKFTPLSQEATIMVLYIICGGINSIRIKHNLTAKNDKKNRF